MTMTGQYIRLEPLERSHIDALVQAAAVDPSLYRWTPLPQGRDGMSVYVDTAIAWREAGTAEPFAIVRLNDGAVVGSTRFWNLERWAWPEGYPRYGRTAPDVCEIGYTWLTASAIRTPVNTEAKLLMLTRAFETWEVLRVCLHTDSRNDRSRAAIERLGAKFEGILRAHRLAADFEIRHSARFSIVAAEWPAIKAKLNEFVAGGRHAR